MPSSFDLPRNNRRKLGEVLRTAIEESKSQDLSMPHTQATAVHEYLKGERAFAIRDPHDPSYIVLEVEQPRNQPSYEAIVSDVAQEIGRQSRVDIAPRVGLKDTTLNGIRDRAVAQGLMSYLFPSDVTEMAHQAFQKFRVEDGGAALAVSETVYPGRGWGLKIDVIPPEEISFLPVGARAYSEVNGVVWRRWVSLRWLRGIVRRIGETLGKKLSLPSEGSQFYRDLNVVQVHPGQGIGRDATNTVGWEINQQFSYAERGVASTEGTVVDMVEFSQVYVTPDRRHIERLVFMVGRHVFHDQEFADFESPQMPIAYAPYAPVGGPYGRSYAYPKMMAHLMAERFIQAMTRTVDEIDTYGIITATGGMGFNWDDITRPSGGGFRVAVHNLDTGAPNQKLEQLTPINIAQVLGNLPNMMLGLPQTVYPSSPLLSGNAPGRVEGDPALARLDSLSNIQIAAGGKMAGEAWAQIYRAGLELGRDHYVEDESIPLVLVDDAMAGVVLDTAEVPHSDEERAADEMARMERAEGFVQQGIDPSFGSAMETAGLRATEAGDLEAPGTPGSGRVQRVPIGRFTIGPNVIPHPDSVAIGIESLMPRDKDKEYQDLELSRKLGYMSAMEVQIEVYKQGLDRFLGGKANWNTYKVAILNLLSAFGDGVNPGPVLVPGVGAVHRVGYWAISTFMSSPEYLMASESVRQKIMTLQQYYDPTNTGQTAATAEEAAMMEAMSQTSGQQQLSPQGLPGPMGIAAA